MDNILNFKEETGKRLKQFMAMKNLTQKDFSESINHEPTTVSRVTKGTNGMSSEMIYAIIDIYPDLSWDWLFKNEGEMIKGSNVVMGEKNHIGNMVVHHNEDRELKEELATLRERVKGLEEQVKLKDQIIELLKNK